MILAEVAYNIWPVLLGHHHLLRDRLLLCQVPGSQTDPLSPQDQARGRSQAGSRPGRLAGLDNFCCELLQNNYL